jgi:hypothetical protein
MQTDEMIAAEEFCTHHQVELSFIHSLQESGLIQISIVEEKVFVPVSQLQQLEKLVRLYYEMDINLEGIETITYLLERMQDMQQQIRRLNDRLSMYEQD